MASDPIDAKPRTGVRALVTSVAGAALGIQSSKIRERDFGSGSPYRFVVAGLVGTLLFVLTMYLIVRVVLRAAGT